MAEDHFGDVVGAMLAGRLVLVLGAGVIDGREGDRAGLPSPARSLAHLVKCFDCPPAHARDLAQVAEYIGLTKGVGPLHDELHALFDGDYAPGPTHRPAGRARRTAAGARRARTR